MYIIFYAKKKCFLLNQHNNFFKRLCVTISSMPLLKIDWMYLVFLIPSAHLKHIVQLSSREQLRFEALFWMASEGGSGLPQLPTSSLEIYTIDWSSLQTFRHWKPYLYLVFYRSIPESSAPRLKQKKVRLGFIKS